MSNEPMSNGLYGKVGIVTGAASGIGRATAERLAAYGCAVCVADLDEDGAAAVAEGIRSAGGRAIHQRVDVGSEADNTAMADSTQKAFDRIDIAHLNAAMLVRGGVLDCDLAAWERALSVNVTGVLLGIRAVAPRMIESGGGAIVVTASVSGILGSKGMPSYTTTKHGVVGLVKAAAADLGELGIRVNAVCPGSTYTGMLIESGTLEEVNRSRLAEMNIQRRVAEPREIAEVVCFLASDAASYVTGGIYPVDGGMSAVGRRSV